MWPLTYDMTYLVEVDHVWKAGHHAAVLPERVLEGVRVVARLVVEELSDVVVGLPGEVECIRQLFGLCFMEERGAGGKLCKGY